MRACVYIQERAHYCWYLLINLSTHTFKGKKKTSANFAKLVRQGVNHFGEGK